MAYEDLDHVRITRDFLNAPERYLKQLSVPERGEKKAPFQQRKGAKE